MPPQARQSDPHAPMRHSSQSGNVRDGNVNQHLNVKVNAGLYGGGDVNAAVSFDGGEPGAEQTALSVDTA